MAFVWKLTLLCSTFLFPIIIEIIVTVEIDGEPVGLGECLRLGTHARTYVQADRQPENVMPLATFLGSAEA